MAVQPVDTHPIPGIYWLSVVVMLTGCLGGPEENDVEEDMAAIRAVSDARADAFNDGDAGGIARHFDENAVLMAPGQPPLRGREAVEAYYQSIFDTYETQLRSGYDEVAVSGDMAYGRGTAVVTLIPHEGGKPTTSTSKYLNILRRRADGRWITTHDIWNGNDSQ